MSNKTTTEFLSASIVFPKLESMCVLLLWWANKQRHEWHSIKGSLWHAKRHSSNLICRCCFCGKHKTWDGIRCNLKNCFFCWFSFFLKIPSFLQCHLLHIKLMSIENNGSCQWWYGLYVLDEPAASYLSSAKVPIDRSTDCASVSPPVQPFPCPSPCLLPYPLSIPPPTPAQVLIDHPCPGSCPQITQLDVFCVWVKWINYQDNRSGDRKAWKSPWMQQRERTEERPRMADMKQMAERRTAEVWRKQKGCFSQDFLWIVVQKCFSMPLQASVGFRRWGSLKKHCCKHCKCPVKGEVEEIADAPVKLQVWRTKHVLLTPRRFEVEKLLLN